jgi:hypothetical protein
MRPTLRHLLYGYASLNLPSQDLKQTLMHTDNGVSPMLLHNFMLSLLDNGHFHAYPPSPDFQKRWWKWAIGTLEGIMSHEGEGSLEEVPSFSLRTFTGAHVASSQIDDRIYEHYVSLLTSSGRYRINHNDYAPSLIQSFSAKIRRGCSLWPWSSSAVVHSISAK